MFVFQTNTVGVELFSYVNAFFCCNEIGIAAGQLLLGLTEIFMFFSFDIFPRP